MDDDDQEVITLKPNQKRCPRGYSRKKGDKRVCVRKSIKLSVMNSKNLDNTDKKPSPKGDNNTIQLKKGNKRCPAGYTRKKSDKTMCVRKTKTTMKKIDSASINATNGRKNMANQSSKSGDIYVASMILRGKRAELPDHLNNALKVNVTSAQRTLNQHRIDFSPMTGIEGGYKGYFCFENYWQAGKVFEDVERDKQLDWWKKQPKGKRRYPNSKGKRVLHAEFNGVEYDYVNSRKNIYVPEYYELAKNTKSMKELEKVLAGGKDIVVFDFDGPRKQNGDNTYRKVTIDMLKEEINAVKFPFGHGYIVAATIKGIKPSEYI